MAGRHRKGNPDDRGKGAMGSGSHRGPEVPRYKIFYTDKDGHPNEVSAFTSLQKDEIVDALKRDKATNIRTITL